MKPEGHHPRLLTGAEAIARILKSEHVEDVFAYPGTSELVLCDAISKIKGIRLINSRGDKEAAFMAAGGSVIDPAKSVAILHGARGLTNAMGAIADIYRNEVGTVFLLGLPSTDSARFLPPHGEKNLIRSISNFTKRSDEITEVNETAAHSFVEKVRSVLCEARTLPMGPTLLGIPQNALETKWISKKDLKRRAKSQIKNLSGADIKTVIAKIRKAKRPVLIVDDPLFKRTGSKEVLRHFAESICAPILQVAYKRGPMLFESIFPKSNPYFIGPYEPDNLRHARIVHESDLIITLEDRNMYPRVIGTLPNSFKIAITSNPKMTLKNEYLRNTDLLLDGDPTEIMKRVMSVLPRKNATSRQTCVRVCEDARKISSGKVFPASIYANLRNMITEEISQIFNESSRPLLVDDSQMFGGILAQNYGAFPKDLRVIGDHGGFIGGGLPFATGVAICNREYSVYCTLGDQSFTNAFQALVSSVENKTNIVYFVCNNGKSVSLTKQILHQNKKAFKNNKLFLSNPPEVNYRKIAQSLGLIAYEISMTPKKTGDLVSLRKYFRMLLKKTVALKGPTLLEIRLPSEGDIWEDIWSVRGNEKMHAK